MRKQNVDGFIGPKRNEHLIKIAYPPSKVNLEQHNNVSEQNHVDLEFNLDDTVTSPSLFICFCACFF